MKLQSRRNHAFQRRFRTVAFIIQSVSTISTCHDPTNTQSHTFHTKLTVLTHPLSANV